MLKGVLEFAPQSPSCAIVQWRRYFRFIAPVLLLLVGGFITLPAIRRQASELGFVPHWGSAVSPDLSFNANDTGTQYVTEEQEKFSIIISTYNRYESFAYLLDYYGNAHIPHLDAIFINWALGAVEPPPSLNLSAFRVPVYLKPATEHSLGQRFRIPPQMKTNVALWLDDDLHVSASAIEFMFRVWKSVGQRDHRIVGRVARLATRDPTGSLVYRPYPQDTYNLVLTGLAFMDKTMSQWYWEDDPLLAEARKHVDVATNCEDILMNYVIARKTGLAPFVAYVPHAVRQVPVTSGISLQGGHVTSRTTCLRKFDDLFGDVLKENVMTMTESSAIVDFGRDTAPLPEQWKPKGRPWGEGKSFREWTASEETEGLA